MKATTMQDLFDGLPVESLADCPVFAEEASPETVEHILRETRRRIRPRRATKRFGVLLIAAAFLIAGGISTIALVGRGFTPLYGFAAPPVSRETILPLTQQYSGATTVGETVTDGKLQVTLESFSADALLKVLHGKITVKTLDGSSLTESTATQLSMLAQMKFAKLELVCEGKAFPNLWNNQIVAYRTDTASIPDEASFEVVCHAEIQANRSYELRLTNLTDMVRTSEDIGFAFENMEALYASMQPAAETDYIEDRLYTPLWSAQQIAAYALSDGGQKAAFSTAWPQTYIDNIGLRQAQSENERPQLLLSFVNMDSRFKPQLIDMRNGDMYASSCTVKEDTGRITVSYPNISRDMLPYLFMMSGQDYHQVVRAEGQWTLPISIKETDILPAHTYAVDERLTFWEYRLHAEKITVTDGGIYMEGTYTTEGVPSITSMGCSGTLFFADGSELPSALYQQGSSELLEDGTFRFSSEWSRFVDSTQITAVTLFDKTIALTGE